MASIVVQLVLCLVINYAASAAFVLLTHATLTSSQSAAVTSSRYIWQDNGQFSECSVTCGQGVSLSVVVCRDSVTGSRVRHELCSVQQRQPVPTSRVCQLRVNCEPWWVIDGTWSTCSKSCDAGLSRRLVYCVEERNDGTTQRTIDTRCIDKKPETQRMCNTQQCSTWVTGAWSQCSVTCDDGVQQRVVVCKQTHDSECDRDLKPSTQQVCHRESCHINSNRDLSVDSVNLKSRDPWPSLLTTNLQQFHDNRKHSHQQADEHQQTIDSTVSVAPVNTLPVPIPVANSRSVPVPATSSPSTGRPRTAPGIRQSVVLIYTVRSSKDHLLPVHTDTHNTLGEKEILLEGGSGEEETVQNTTPSSTVTFLSSTPLTEAEQNEELELSKKTNDNNNIYQLHTVTARWKAITEYGECSVRCGGYGVRQRQVECVLKRYSDDIDVVVPASCCRWQLKPIHQILCYQGPCNVHWASVGWSQCSCGANATTTRVFQCIQQSTLIVVDSAYCSHLATPVLDTHRCYLPACVKETSNNHKFGCQDNSVYCALVAQLRLCRLSQYKQQCCYSCSHLPVATNIN